MSGPKLNQDIADALELHPYQIKIAEFVLRTPRCGLFLPVGSGKTRITLAILSQLGFQAPVLVIAPANVARLSWAEEMEKLNLGHLYRSFVTGPKGGKTLPKKRRIEMYERVQKEKPALYTISKELTPDIVEWYGKNWPFPIVIVDELQAFKDPSAKCVKALKKAMPMTYRFTGLTGTPTPKGLMDLWSEIWFMDGGARLGKSVTKYRRAFFDEGLYVNGVCVEWRPKRFMPLLDRDLDPVIDAYGNPVWPVTPVSAKTVIYERIKDIVISADVSSLIKLPDKIERNHMISLDDEEMAAYKKLAKDQVLRIAEKTEDDGKERPDDAVIIAQNAAALSQKLAQLASGTVYTGEDHQFVQIHDKKVQHLRYILDNEPTPVLVAYWYQSDKEVLLREFPQAVPFSGEPKIKEKWDKGEIPVMLVHPASVGAGLNLQKGGHVLVWYTLPWGLEPYIQMNGRIYRQGQAHTTIIHYLLAKGTIDERIPRVLAKKDLSQQDLIDAVRFATA